MNQCSVPCLVLTVASCPVYRFLRGQVKWTGIPISLRIFHSLLSSLVAQSVKSLPAIQETWVQSLGQEDPLGGKRQPTPVFLPREFHGQSYLVGNSPWGHKDLDTTEWLTLLLVTVCCDSQSQGLLHSKRNRSRWFFWIPYLFLWCSIGWQFNLWFFCFSKFSLYIWKFSVHILLKPSLKDFYLCLWESNNELISEFHSTSENYLKAKSHLYQCCENVACNNCPVTFYSGDTNEN